MTVRPVVLSIGFVVILVIVLFLAFYVHSDDHSHNVTTSTNTQHTPNRSHIAPSHLQSPHPLPSLPPLTRLSCAFPPLLSVSTRWVMR